MSSQDYGKVPGKEVEDLRARLQSCIVERNELDAEVRELRMDLNNKRFHVTVDLRMPEVVKALLKMGKER